VGGDWNIYFQVPEQWKSAATVRKQVCPACFLTLF
jgi:hypothetical protein